MSDDSEQLSTEVTRQNYEPEDYFVMANAIDNVSAFRVVQNLDTSLKIVGETFASNLLNAYLTSAFIGVLARRMAGMAYFMGMYGINLGADKMLERLRKSAEEDRNRDLFIKTQQDIDSPEWNSKVNEGTDHTAKARLAEFLQDKISRDCAEANLRQCFGANVECS